MSVIQERGSTHVYKVNRISKDEIENMVSLCVYDQPAFCSAACPLKLDAKAMLAAAADGDFKKALGLYEKAVIFPNVVSAGCSAPCEAKCKLSELGEGIAVRDIERAVTRFGEKSRSGGVFRMKKKKSVALFGSGLFALCDLFFCQILSNILYFHDNFLQKNVLLISFLYFHRFYNLH